MKTKSLVIAGLMLFAALFAMSGQARAEVNISVNIGGPPVIVERSPWDPSPGVAVYAYNYYPAIEVYFDPGRGLYFYLEAGRWHSTRVLPPYIVVAGNDYVILNMDGPEPHRHHIEVQKRYPSAQWIRRERPRHQVVRPWDPRPNTPRAYRYRYYPSSGIYFDPDSKVYFYLEGKVWRSSPSRPRNIVYSDHDYIILDMDGPEPYRHHNDVEKHYPRGQWNKYENERHRDDDWYRERDDDRGRDRDRDRDRDDRNGKGKRRDRD